MKATGFCMFIFGKKFKELTLEERREFYRLMKRRSRNLDPNAREKARLYYENNKDRLKKQRQEWREKNPEKVKQNDIKHSKKKEEPFAHALSRQMFGCKVTEMTPEQRKIYNTTRCLRYQKRKRDESKATTIL